MPSPWLLVAAVALWGLLLVPASAGDVPAPTIPKGKGEQCVADTDFMRRNHMDLLTHQRDDTVRRGMRGAKFSLNGCVECHAVADSACRPVTSADPKHFCRACHDYAAVRVDCFDCHASRPEPKMRAAATGATKAGRR